MTDELPDTLHEIVARLEAHGIAYMVVGSVAASVYGRQRATQDFDVVVEASPFSETEFARRARLEVMGVSTYVASVEDVIVAKLEWAKAGGSERQLEDVRELVRVRSKELDRSYVEQWIERLGLREQWQRANGA